MSCWCHLAGWIIGIARAARATRKRTAKAFMIGWAAALLMAGREEKIGKITTGSGLVLLLVAFEKCCDALLVWDTFAYVLHSFRLPTLFLAPLGTQYSFLEVNRIYAYPLFVGPGRAGRDA